MYSPESSSNSTIGGWLKFFADAGVLQDVRSAYSAAFMENHIERSILKELNKEMLQDMGIKPIGDIILILRHIRELSNEELLEKPTAGAGGASANIAKVRPQASVTVGDHSKKPITPTVRGGETPGSASSQSAMQVPGKVPKTNARQKPLLRNEKMQLTSVAPGNSRLGVKKKKKNMGTIVKVGQNTPSSVSKSTGLLSGANVKLRQVPRASSAQSVRDDLDDVGLEVSRVEQNVEDSISVTVSKERETNVSPRQNTDVPATPVKRAITCSRNTANPSPKLKQVSRGGKKPVVVGKIASVRCAPSITGSNKVQTKSILKKDVSLGKMNGTKSGQMIADTAGPLTTNFVSYTKSPYFGDRLRLVEGPGAEKTNFLRSAVTYESHEVQDVGMKQRVVCKPVSLPVDNSDETDSLTSEEATGLSEHVSQDTDMDVNSTDQDALVMQVMRLVSHPTSGETADGSSTAGESATRPAAQKNVVSLRTVKYGCKPKVQSVKKVRRIPPGHEGTYTIIMPKGRAPSHQAGVQEENCDDSGENRYDYGNMFEYPDEYESFIGDEEGGQHYVDFGGGVDDEELYDEELDEDAVVNDQLELTFGELPRGNVPSVFERLGWKYRGHHRGRRFRGFGMYSGSFRHFRSTKQGGSVFSRLNPTKMGHTFHGRQYLTRNARGVRRPWKYNTTVKNSRAPEIQISSRQLVVRQKEPAIVHQPIMSNTRLNVPAKTVNMDLSAAPAKKSVRFGTKEELCFSNTIKVTESLRKPLVGSITLKSGVFDKLGT